jgi:selenocysteine lyase/cysteine desulfurase
MMTARRAFIRSASLAFGFWRGSAPAAQTAPPLPAAGDPLYWDKIREQFLLAHDKVFFNCGTIGAMPKVVFDRTVDHLRKMAVDVADWDYRGENWIAGYGPEPEIRAKAARLLNAEVREIALTENVTCANSEVASGLDVEAGSEILISDQEHPGGQSPWYSAAKRRGAVVRQVALPRPASDPEQILDLVRKAVTPRTRVLFLSHVITGSGAILPVREICGFAAQHGIFTVIDGAQAFGHIPVDVKAIGCDAYVGCFHKWLLAPAGTGFLYVRRERMKEIWTTLASSAWDDHEDNGYRLMQRGTGSMSLLAGLDAALDFHMALGPERVHARIKQLGDRLRDGLRGDPRVRIYSPADPAMCAGITVYAVEGLGGPQLQDEMWKRGRLRPRANGDGVRHSTHVFNSPAEIDRALEIVRALARA